MTEKKKLPVASCTLREQDEAKSQACELPLDARLSLDQMRQAFLDLRIHFIQLYARNEELRRTQVKLQKKEECFRVLFNEAGRLKGQIRVETNERKAVNQALLVTAVRNHELKDEADTLRIQMEAEIAWRKNVETDLRESKSDADRANRAKDEFIAALSHELRTPLTPVLLIANSLVADQGLDPGLHGQMEMIRQNAELEVNLIDDLLDITKIVHGKISLHREDLDIHQLLQRALNIVMEDLVRKRIAVEAHSDARHSCAYADPTRIQQVFWNVIKNAAKFTPEGGSIHIRTFNSDDQTLIVEICDTGIGIAQENLSSLFRPFEQGAATGIQRFGGLGLGMTISKAIVDLHEGGISAASEGVGQGATFTIRLPVSESSAAACAPSQAPPVQGTAPLHILLVEDHEHTRVILARLLSKAGHAIEAVGSCTAAYEAAKAAGKTGACPFQAIISDLGLPDGSGLDLIRKIKAQFPEINAVAVSGYGTDEDLRKSAEAGFDHHLVKPLGMESLCRALAT